MFSHDRDEYRKVFFESWRKHQTEQFLEPLEGQLVEIMLLHPEYHALLNQAENYQTKDFSEDNPFLHMSLHLGIREQVATNRPAGIREVYLQLCEKNQNVHLAEHQMMEYLATVLWEGQKNGKMLDEQEYLEGLKKL